MAEPESKPESIHAGHRKRMLEAYLQTGLEGFSDVEALEILLGYAIARQDVNPLAHALLQEFGDLHRVLNAPIQQLVRVPGIGLRTAALIHLIDALWRKGEESRIKGRVMLHTTQEIGRYLAPRAKGLREERVWLLSLDAKCEVIECRELCRGSVNSVNIPFRKLVEAALLANASSVVLAHNHTTGTLLPSLEDLEYTRGALRALQMVDVILTDHMILCDGNFLSMRSSRMMPE
ncbi:MAG: RadC family protein [Oscillospiraceae bacterium]|nr:RadC family protein [Oscillospiraceae bacterium]